MSIIKTITWCGRQCLPLRAHWDYGTFYIKQEPEYNETVNILAKFVDGKRRHFFFRSNLQRFI